LFAKLYIPSQKYANFIEEVGLSLIKYLLYGYVKKAEPVKFAGKPRGKIILS